MKNSEVLYEDDWGVHLKWYCGGCNKERLIVIGMVKQVAGVIKWVCPDCGTQYCLEGVEDQIGVNAEDAVAKCEKKRKK